MTDIHAPAAGSADAASKPPRRTWPVAELSVLGGLLGAILAALVVWAVTPNEFVSTGIINVVPHPEHILDDRPGIPVDLDAFTSPLVAFLRSERVIDMAMMSDRWTTHGRGSTPAEAQSFIAHLQISHAPSSSLIYVSFSDREPAVALDAVRAVIDAFNKSYLNSDLQQDRHRLQQLTTLADAYHKQIVELDHQMAEITKGEGATTVQSHSKSKAVELNAAESAWDATRQSLQFLQAMNPAPAAGTAVLDDARAAELHAMTIREQVEHQQYDTLHAQTLALAKQEAEIAKAQHDIDIKQSLINTIRDTMERLDIEAGAAGQIEIISDGDSPVKKENIASIATAATLGFVGGIFLVSFLRRRPA